MLNHYWTSLAKTFLRQREVRQRDTHINIRTTVYMIIHDILYNMSILYRWAGQCIHDRSTQDA